jgi:23S rRNA (guanosine2251-2'-O)-methyltransferase
MKIRWVYGFHAVQARLRAAPQSILEVWVDAARQDARMRDFLERVAQAGLQVHTAEGDRLDKMVGGARHQGVVAKVEPVVMARSLDEVVESIVGAPLVLVLDGVTDPHNLGAVLRSADAFCAHAVLAPKDRSVGLNATVEKVACGAAETVPYLMVTNLARSLEQLKEHRIWTVAADAEAGKTIAQIDAKSGIAWVLGAEGAGLRQLTRKTCDETARIPIGGSVESLNVSVSAAICLYEAARQRA